MLLTERALERAEDRTPEAYDGDGWNVCLCVGGAVDGEWVVPAEQVAPYVVARLAGRLCREVEAECAGSGERVEVWVTHVFMSPDVFRPARTYEATGYHFFPAGRYC